MLSSVVYSLLATALLGKAVEATQVAAYWGQNSGGDQGRLQEYCDSNTADIIILSFLNDFPEDLNVNFSNQCGATFPSGLLHCSAIGEDITYCQKQGKKVVLSLGGHEGKYGVSEGSSQDLATTLWNKFGAGSDSERPFDGAVVDGFDLDLEHGDHSGLVTLSNSLRAKYSEDASKKYLLTASPQCVFPDANVGDALAKADIDYTFVQFYNNDCALDQQFNWNSWSNFVNTTSPNKNNKIFVGLPGSPASAGSGYVSTDVVEKTVDAIRCDPNFGGISLWDASSAWANTVGGKSYAAQIKNILSSAKACTAPDSPHKADPVPVPAKSSSATPLYSNSTTSAAPAATTAPTTITATDIQTTVITITSCSDHKCTKVPVTTGLTTVTENETIYTTYCPLSTDSIVTETDASTTVVTITSCEDNKCTEVPVTTGLTTITENETIYTTYCPIETGATSSVAPSSSSVVAPSSSSIVAPPSSSIVAPSSIESVASSVEVAPTTFPVAYTTVSTSTLYNTVTIAPNNSTNNGTQPQVSSNSEGMAVSIQSSIALVMLSILAAMF
ncbi:chitinase 2 [[Candida] anglica]|uniref:chitinase n=1 Tax=[Candida] anglica TaxID=148631 RepID=A0ABP0E9Y1_9ASCO